MLPLLLAALLAAAGASPVRHSRLPDADGALAASASAAPRNLTDYFKGRWSWAGDGGPAAAAAGADGAAAGVPLAKASGGDVIMQLSQRETTQPGVDAVAGALHIRDGVYAGEQALRFALQGLYVVERGALYLYANPRLAEVTDHVGASAERIRNETGVDVSKVALPPNGNAFTSQPPDTNCAFNITATAKHLSGSISASDGTPKEIHSLEGVLLSSDCAGALEISIQTIDFQVYFNKAVNYSLFVVLNAFAYLVTLIKQMDASATPAKQARMSLMTLGWLTGMDSYLCLIHLTTAILFEAVFQALATAAFFLFVTFSVFEMRLLVTVWKARRPEGFNQGMAAMRAEISTLYTRFYAGLALGMFLFYALAEHGHLFLFILYSFWIPQIVCNVGRGTRRPFALSYIVVTSVTRLALPLYLYACPDNILRIKPDYATVQLLVAYLFTQVLVLIVQDTLGARFFVPASMLPAKYNYYRGPPAAALEEGSDCVICMSELEPEDTDLMVTPCDHVFHGRCLQEWMRIKLECPTCRGILPAFDADEDI